MRRLLLWCVMGWSLCSGTAWAQIKIGQTAGFSGAVAATVKEATEGAKMYFEAINAKGGVGGQQLELISLDDKFDPKLSAQNAKLLIDQGVICIFLNRGTPQTQSIMPLLTEHKIPLLAPSTGAMVLHEPVHPWLFNVRTTYQREAERVITHLGVIGVERIALVTVDDSFGEDAAIGALRGLKGLKKEPVAHVRYNRTKPDFGPIMPKVTAADPQSVLFVGSGTAIVDGMKALRAAGSRAQMITLSNNASAGFIKELGDLARGTVISQVFPYERSIATLVVKEAQELAKARQIEVTPIMIEGYVAAKVLVEGLRRAGPNPTRAGLRKALESFNKVDLGGMELTYGPNDHTGLDYVDLAIIGPNGKFVR